MRISFSLLRAAILPLLIFARPMAVSASTQSDLEQEYLQVRKIALKDPRVQEAFARANDRLDAKILQIDPALKPIVDRQSRASAPVAVQAQPARIESHPFISSTPQGLEHIVTKGETLSSIAVHYKVKVSTLEKVNHITNDRRLQVGQKIVIPSGTSLETQPAAENREAKPKDNDAAASQEAQPKDDSGLGEMWDRVKNSF